MIDNINFLTKKRAAVGQKKEMDGGATPRTATTVVGAAPTASNNLPTLPPSSSLSNSRFPVSGNCSALGTRPSANCVCPGGVCSCERGGGRQGGRADGSFINRVLGLVPSRFEVENAITALQIFLHGISSSGSEIQTQRYSRVYEAFRLLQTDTSIQRMVMSLASDKAVWDAVLNNRMVRKLWEPLCPGIHAAEAEASQSSEELEDLGAHILKWILEMTKVKIMELVEKFQSLVNEVFQSPEDGGSTTAAANQVDEKIVSSTFLAMVILLIVVVARAGSV